ncbi:MAG: hypothetical protein Q4E87_08565 [bacterium]|nr:hypothetical protein [bacterium]
MNTRLNIDINSDIDFENSEDIEVDFSSIDKIALQDIENISDIHRVAVLNGKKLYIQNAAPEVMQILAMTGLHRTFTNFEDAMVANSSTKNKRGV